MSDSKLMNSLSSKGKGILNSSIKSPRISSESPSAPFQNSQGANAMTIKSQMQNSIKRLTST